MEVPLFSFIYHCSFVGCAVHDDVGQPLVPHSMGGVIWWKKKREAFIFSGVLIAFG